MTNKNRIHSVRVKEPTGARGVDSLAEEYADRKGIEKLIFKPDYEKYGKFAPLVRNRLIVDNADIVFAFWDGKSRGTKFTIDYAKERGIEVVVFLMILPNGNDIRQKPNDIVSLFSLLSSK